MIVFFYNLILSFYFLLSIPKFLYQFFRYKKHVSFVSQKIEQIIQKIPKNKEIVWFHAVSLGEAKVGLNFLEEFIQRYPRYFIIFTTITETGKQEITNNPHVDLCFHLPLDFSWTMRKILERVQPTFVFIIETDFWWNFLSQAKKYAKIFLLNGKLSKKSFERYKACSFFSRRLFTNFTHIFVQNEIAAKRFAELSVIQKQISITGNLKASIQPQKTSDIDVWRKHFHLEKTDQVITLASTHFPEEKLLLDILSPFMQNYKILLAPRHPERFPSVKKLIRNNPRIILIDKMGMLPICFQLSHAAIVGGSFVKNIGGHNILEPTLYQTPVLFGPYLDNQKDLQHLIEKYHLGLQTSLEHLESTLQKVLTDPSFRNSFSSNIQKWQTETQKNKSDIFSTLEFYIKKVEVKTDS